MLDEYIEYLKKLSLKLNLYYIYSNKIGIEQTYYIKNTVCKIENYLREIEPLDLSVDDDINYFEEIKHYIDYAIECVDLPKIYSMIYEVVDTTQDSIIIITNLRKERQYIRNVSSNLSTDNAATGILVPETPSLSIRVKVSGFVLTIGNGIKTKDIYFSGDGGTTARLLSNVQEGDEMYYNALIAGATLTSSHEVETLII